MIIYHITRNEDLLRVLNGEQYIGDSLKTEGFIHCSTAAQVIDVANQRFKRHTGLVLLCIETDLVKSEIRWENLESGNKLFPHIYGPLNRDAIRCMVNLIPRDDGNFVFPSGEISGA